MDIGEIIALIIGLPLLIFAIYKFIVIWWIEGNITESLLSAFRVPQAIIILFSIIGIFVLILGIFKLVSSVC
jgi:hypothetical protein